MNKTFIKGQIEQVQHTIANLKEKHQLHYPVDICVASKYATAAEVRYIHSQGLTLFGENRVQDALQKQEDLQDLDINWHFIGHLQTNKINKILPSFNCIQSVDRLELIEQLHKKCSNLNIKKDILLQFNPGDDPNKFGFSLNDETYLLDQLQQYNSLDVKGIMLIAPLINDEKELAVIFEKTKKTYDKFSEKYDKLSILSMGMSQDYQLAIKCGSNMVRIGRFIFKEK